jgi:hypothetical protein
LTVAAWGLGLLAVIGGAILGGNVGSDAVADVSLATSALPAKSTQAHPTSAAAARATSAEAATATGTGRFGDDISAAVIRLESPGGANPVITTRDVEVRGRVREGAGPVVVRLESSSPDRMIVVTMYPVRLPDSGDGGHRSEFTGTLPLPDPRPTGLAVVYVIAFDTSGTAADVLLRTIQIGPFLDPTYGDGTGRPPTGEDGLMGGIPYGTNFAWQADGR